ncbi:recombinase family protein [Pararhizobium mangrovi]|uniref:Recombinase family protein n=1 Tax=Pararhizobium mangrovi TaxID=2590452 RepID=A0A506U1X8_9HYPH|nr:recombinase family protein [Pararhizobium mangrovi]TPW27456.1 recombinase family protein [Pararhizobium mangrovi]
MQSEQQAYAYSYIRMSTSEQIKGDSLRRQLEMSREYAKRHGLQLDESLRDIGVSAFKGKNSREGALSNFLRMVEDGRVKRGSYLLIESLDRLSRQQVLDALSLFMDILRSGITIVTMSDGERYSSESVGNDWTRLIVSLSVMARAHEESARKSERLGQANANKRKRARETGVGMTALTPGWIDAHKITKGQYEFTLNEHAETIQKIFELTAQGLGATAIAKYLNAREVPTLKSKRGWYQSIVKRLLNRDDVLGTFQPHRKVNGIRIPEGEPIEGYFPPVVSKDLYDRAQRMRRRQQVTGRKGATFPNLFSGLAVCKHCGGPMACKSQTLKRDGLVHYLLCDNHNRGYRCHEGRKHFRIDHLENAILDNVNLFEHADVFQRQQVDKQAKELAERISAKETELRAIKQRETNLVSAVENATDVDLLVEQLRKRKQERQECENELRSLNQHRDDLTAEQSDALGRASRMKTLREQWRVTEDMDERYRLRAEAHMAIRDIVDLIICNSRANAVRVALLENMIVHEFQDGELVLTLDLTKHHVNDQKGSLTAQHFAGVGPDQAARLRAAEAHISRKYG